MKNKGLIFGGIAAVVIIIILAIYFMAKSSADKKEEESDRLADTLDDEDTSLSEPEVNSRKECRQLCRTICKRKSLFGKGRNKCKKTCKADCAVHDIDYVKANAANY